MSDPAAIEAKIGVLEAEMARTQKNKATNYRK
jgi:ribosome-interacting GTPase 1